MNGLDYDHFAQLLKRRSGIELGPDKGYLLQARLQAVAGTLGLADVAALLAEIRVRPAGPMVDAAIDAMTTNETFFFRDNSPFDHLKAMLPALVQTRRGQPVRIWSAACSTGQEPYSIAMLAEEEAPGLSGLRVEITATDLSDRCLRKAKAGLYSQFEAQRGLTIQRLVRHFDQTPAGWQVKPHLQRAVNWRTLNLLDDFRALGTFDVVFCRNVLIYFDKPTKAQVLERIAAQMSAEGRLVLGAAETVLGVTQAFQAAPGAFGLYMKPTGNAARGAALAAG